MFGHEYASGDATQKSHQNVHLRPHHAHLPHSMILQFIVGKSEKKTK